jgi:DNA-binding CsgD family transcriptional regulator
MDGGKPALPDQADTARSERGSTARVLARFSVSDAAERAWHVLLSVSEITDRDLGKAAALSPDDIDAAIAELLAASLVHAAPTPTGVSAIEPSLALETLMVRAERATAQQAEDFARLRTELPGLSSGYRSAHAGALDTAGLEVVRDLAAVQARIRLAAERVRSEVRAIDHAPAVIVPPNSIDGEIEYAMLERGVRDRAILATASLSRPGVHDSFLRLQERGHDARHLPDVTTRAFIFDTELAVIPVDPNNLSLGATFIHSRNIIDVLVLGFDQMWSVATPIFSDARDGDAPIGRHARILELVALGSKDEAISRALGIGVRTIRRDIAGIKTGLGVSSRAEIVAAAVRKGWL